MSDDSGPEIDPIFEQALREAMAHFNNLLREASEISRTAERQRIREIIVSHEDDDGRCPGVLTDQLLEEIEREEEGGG